MNDELTTLRGLVDELYRKLCDRANRGEDRRGCRHLTMGTQFLPCPHPDCFPNSQQRFHRVMVPPAPTSFTWQADATPLPTGPAIQVETWERVEVVGLQLREPNWSRPGEDAVERIWAWRRVA